MTVIYFLRIKEKLFEKERKRYYQNKFSEENNYQDLEPSLPWLNEVNDMCYNEQNNTSQVDSFENEKTWDDNTGYNTLYNDYYFDYGNI